MRLNTMLSSSTLRYALVLILLICIPLMMTNQYYIHLIILVMMNIILAMSFRLIMTTGQVSLAHSGFMLVGAYASTLLVMRLGISFWLALPLAGLVAAAIAVLLGYPFMRIKGIYFLILTFALGEAFVRIVQQSRTFLGGYTGIYNIPKPDAIDLPGLPAIEFVSKTQYYYLMLVLLVIAFIVMRRIEFSRLGNIFKMIGTNDTLASSLGVNIMNYKVLAFAIGCFFAAIVGSFYAHYVTYISATTFTFALTISILTYAIVGGPAKLWGPVIGAAVVTIVSEELRITGYYQVIFYAVLLILVVLFVRHGLVGLVEAVVNRVKGRVVNVT
jgi:branched-chain amino acid transport system permease protein